MTLGTLRKIVEKLDLIYDKETEIYLGCGEQTGEVKEVTCELDFDEKKKIFIKTNMCDYCVS
tara:strand:- start:1352 stop:1537 length:186 start_codon:yes stop_codon:yes gene_type:complete